MEHGEAPGVASLKEGQPLFLAGLWSAVTCHRSGTKAPTGRRTPRRRTAVAQFGYLLTGILLDLDRRRSDFRMQLRPMFEITICDLKLKIESGRGTWTQSVPSAVADGLLIIMRNADYSWIRTLHPSATADGTDCVQVPRPDFEAKRLRSLT